ncbi:TipAS antibiotic-recognition domain-containing protein [Herbiconiux sp. CPCC 203407]|uniref:TipAS antibiotic-recognition domain-containing protein n=1 Tax=Herbiconiux oxytropis TaxID=2970915 RepID=A0AA42BX06_9MICO|nr:TipAS antibiotic-recognition domain-containing protein [Herbiconiux oxytropis]MCS5723281.1 TipAS antibiotic-recognition domain-containing protein [Herbiconiux oxytropis]MCS5727823.1 TipAS antibiotic-recognition domain-containing protein [Herbiconiux oxytropis]
MTEWSIQELARHAGVTSRTLRHYDAVGLVPPSRVGSNGYRYYDASALVRLQRVLLLRGLGLGLPAIASVLEGSEPPVVALERHLELLSAEHDRLARQRASVRRTIDTLREGGQLMPATMFDGFDHTRHEAEVTERWGAAAYAEGDAWWKSLGQDGRRTFTERLAALNADWQAAAAAPDADPAGPAAQELARRHLEWLASVPGAPGTPGAAEAGPQAFAAYARGLADLYAADPRFAAHYGGTAGAAFVRDALHGHLDVKEA